MTVIELRDALDKYIKTDPPGLWQLNDVEADAAAYRERCKIRANNTVVVTDDSMKSQHFLVNLAGGTSIVSEIMPGTYASTDAFAIIVNLKPPLA